MVVCKRLLSRLLLSLLQLNTHIHSTSNLCTDGKKFTWRPTSDIAAPVHARNTEMTEYEFTHITAVYKTDSTVTFATSSKTECISIASNWAEGEEKWKGEKEYHKTGFIGQGFTKQAIYCWFEDCDMALTQIILGGVTVKTM
ncbi:hypothetical protein PILCRDRAFT_87902 [Piloderma croceum F 1598]|uniref:SCP domain-containing protein n=1 Tax=Piloderma croceum (strain F 1598) TaxID=765440 RepID=A0A0C3C341_PILCF|nr:hypothetical protein PILCRDRAFT_87902 [Piloderma croceum F 1598]